jgi:hypothetical protein
MADDGVHPTRGDDDVDAALLPSEVENDDDLTEDAAALFGIDVNGVNDGHWVCQPSDVEHQQQ